jgi:hypothetical protein
MIDVIKSPQMDKGSVESFVYTYHMYKDLKGFKILYFYISNTTHNCHLHTTMIQIQARYVLCYLAGAQTRDSSHQSPHCLPELVPSSGPGKPSSSPGSLYPPLGFAPLVLPSTILDLSIASLSSLSIHYQHYLFNYTFPFALPGGAREFGGGRRHT